MNLDLFNNFINNTKENDVVKNFIQEISNFLNSEANEESLLEKLLNGRQLTTRFRDEINIQRNEIVTKYSKNNSKEGEFFYVYSKGANNTYGIVKHKNDEVGSDIWINERQLPKGAGVDSVLRVKNGKFILDKEATQNLKLELTEMINKLIEEQSIILKSYRIEGHIYEFIEKGENSVWLIDKTDSSNGCFQEINFEDELLNDAVKGKMYKFTNGKYVAC